MKNLAFLLIAACLTLGVVSATTAYVPSLSLDNERLIGLTINAPSGVIVGADGSREPMIADETVITEDVLRTLRDADVKRVRVKEFSLARWSHWWLMLLACIGLTAGGVMVRVSTRKEIAAAMAHDGASDEQNPVAVLGRIRETVASLHASLAAMPNDAERNHAIIEQLGEVQATLVPAFVEARARLIARLGLGGFAEVMDRFAAAERQINRCWSAAADGVYDEAIVCLERSIPIWEEAAAKLGG